jgi:hypothetical protein
MSFIRCGLATERRVSARRGWAGEITAFLNILHGLVGSDCDTCRYNIFLSDAFLNGLLAG